MKFYLEHKGEMGYAYLDRNIELRIAKRCCIPTCLYSLRLIRKIYKIIYSFPNDEFWEIYRYSQEFKIKVYND